MASNQQVLLTPSQMALADQAAIQSGVSAFQLMAAAGQAVVDEVVQRWSPCRVLVMAGPGNNGGDGFVIANLLLQAGWPVTLAYVGRLESMSEEAQAHAKNGQSEYVALSADLLEQADLVVDALFGAGLSRPIDGHIKSVLTALADSGIPVCAVDVPSGLDGATGKVLGIAVKAQLTVTFFRKKPGHLLLLGRHLCGELVVSDIGIPPQVLPSLAINCLENHPENWLPSVPRYQLDGHKFHRGHVLVYGGRWMTGASRLSAKAALRVGAGLVSMAVPESAWSVYAAAQLAIMVNPLTDAKVEKAFEVLLQDDRYNTILIGPGAGLEGAHKGRLQQGVLDALATQRPCLLDADAISAFADDPLILFSAIQGACVLTPHEGEFARLFPHLAMQTGLDKVSRAQLAAKQSNSVIVLKGADTVIASPDGLCAINTNAPPVLATAGSGDVLAGLIAGLMAQGMPIWQAACAGVWIHGELGNLLGVGLIAEDLVEAVPMVLKGLVQ